MSQPRALDRLVARALRLGLPPQLHPAMLVAAVTEAVLRESRGGEAPNRVVIRLNPSDARQLQPLLAELREALPNALEAAVGGARLRPFGPWEVTFIPSAAVPPGEPGIAPDYHDPAAPRSASATRDTVHLRRVIGLQLRFEEDGRAIPLTHTPFLLGRAPGCDLVVPHLAVSRRHAELRHAPTGALELRDLGSRNGTFLRGERIIAAPIAPGDRFALGPVALILEAAP